MSRCDGSSSDSGPAHAERDRWRGATATAADRNRYGATIGLGCGRTECNAEFATGPTGDVYGAGSKADVKGGTGRNRSAEASEVQVAFVGELHVCCGTGSTDSLGGEGQRLGRSHGVHSVDESGERYRLFGRRGVQGI